MICWLQITAGRGPDECCWVVSRVLEEIVNEATHTGYRTRILEAIPGNRRDILKSVFIAIEGESELEGFILAWEGTIQWIGKSMFRPNHKRRNWFVGVTSLQPVEDSRLRDNEFKIERMRASGPGGQHTNKTETAIRVTHIPTGITAVAQEERSQYLNRSLALARLHKRLEREREAVESESRRSRWSRHNSLERGNPVRVYEGEDFSLKR